MNVSTFLIYSLIGAIVCAYAPYALTAYGRVLVARKSDDKMEMLRKPRALFDALPDFAKRAYWAHQNGFEALVVYSISALSAIVTGVDSERAIYAAIIFLIARVLYSVFYITNIAPLRSLMFGIANVCNIVLLSLSVVAAQNL